MSDLRFFPAQVRRPSSHCSKTAKDISPEFRVSVHIPAHGHQQPYGQEYDLPYPQTPATGFLQMPVPQNRPLSPPASRLSGSCIGHEDATQRYSIGHLDSANPYPNQVHTHTHLQNSHELGQALLPDHVQQQGFYHPDRPPTPPASLIDHFGTLKIDDDLGAGSEASSFRRGQRQAQFRAEEGALSEGGGNRAAQADDMRSPVGSSRQRRADNENRLSGTTAHDARSIGNSAVSRQFSRSRAKKHGWHFRPRGEADAYYDENVTFSSEPPYQHGHLQQQHHHQQPQAQPMPPSQAQHEYAEYNQQNLPQQSSQPGLVELSLGPIGLLKEYNKACAGDPRFYEGGDARVELLRRTNGFWNGGKTGKMFDAFRFHPEKRGRFKRALERRDPRVLDGQESGEKVGDIEGERRQHERSQNCWCLTELRSCSHDGHSARLHICPRRSCKNAEKSV